MSLSAPRTAPDLPTSPRRRPLRRVAAAATTLGVTAGLLAMVGTAPTAAQPGPETSATTKRAPGFTFKGWGYGTRVQGGQVPAGLGPTAYQIIACTDQVGARRTNTAANVALPSLGTINGVKTRVWTTKSRGEVSTWARNTIGKVTLSDSPLGSLVLDAVSTTARAYHDGKSFQTETNTDLARLRFEPAMGPTVELPIPTPSQPVDIPGVGTVELAHDKTHAAGNRAKAFANGLKVTLEASGTVVRVAHAVAQIFRAGPSGIFAGEAYGVHASAADGVVEVDRNPLVKIGCLGTGGKTKTNSLASLDLAGQLSVGALTSSATTDQNAAKAWGRASSTVASVKLSDALEISGITAQVKVVRKGGKLTRNAKGTSLGQILVNGEPQEIPSQTIEIPGLAKLEPRVVTKLPGGIKVTALRITLLDGTGATVDLGNARMRVKRTKG